MLLDFKEEFVVLSWCKQNRQIDCMLAAIVAKLLAMCKLAYSCFFVFILLYSTCLQLCDMHFSDSKVKSFRTLSGMLCCAMCNSSSRLKGRTDSAGLSEYAKHCLREICSQEWVREKFLKEPDHLFTVDLLLDKMLSNRQVTEPDFMTLMLHNKCLIHMSCCLGSCDCIEDWFSSNSALNCWSVARYTLMILPQKFPRV